MPDFYAHQVFGRLVWDDLGRRGARLPAAEQPAFRLGLYGPDPLFFHHPVSREGHLLHRLPPRTVLDRYRAPGALETPGALGYAAGFLCHYLLDAACHPYILAVSGGSSLRHLTLEGALDRRLYASSLPAFPRPLPADGTIYAAAAVGYTAGAEQLAQAVRRFFLISRVTRGFRRVSPARPGHIRQAALLQETLVACVPCAAALTARLAEALRSGGTLDFLPQRDFSGRDVLPDAVPVPAPC